MTLTIIVGEIYYRFIIRRKNKKYIKRTNKKQAWDTVLQINTRDIKGGASRIAHSLFEMINSDNYRSYMLVDSADGQLSNINIIQKDYSRIQKLLWRYQNQNGYLDLFHLSTFGVHNLSCFKESDIVHFHNLHGNFFNPFAIPLLTAMKPTIWTLHDMQSFTGHCAHSFNCEKWLDGCVACPDLTTYPTICKDTASLLYQIKSTIFNNSEFTIVCPSEWLKIKVERSMLKNKEVKLIYNGIDEKVFTPERKQLAREKLKLPKEKQILFFTAERATDNIYKGGHIIKKVYESLRNNDDLLFICVGSDKTNNNFGNWVDIPYINDQQELALYYAASDLFIYPSLADNCPLVVLESMSCGTPVIAFRTGGIPELIDHLENGYLAAYNDSDDFIKGITYFLMNPSLCQSASVQARKKIEKKFTLKNMAEQYCALYDIEFNKRKKEENGIPVG